jgi:hypothetical protein
MQWFLSTGSGDKAVDKLWSKPRKGRHDKPGHGRDENSTAARMPAPGYRQPAVISLWTAFALCRQLLAAQGKFTVLLK